MDPEIAQRPMLPGDLQPSSHPSHRKKPETDPDHILLTIAGYDPSGGAGITADLKTFAAHYFFGISAITALTVQSTMGVQAMEPIDPSLLRQTLDYLTQDLPPRGIKIGMLGSAATSDTVAAYLEKIREKSCYKQQIKIVLDTIVKSSSGRELASQATLRSLEKRLLPLVDWITPNWPELAALTGYSVTNMEEAESATHALGNRYPHLFIVVTGGDQTIPVDLLRLPTGEIHLIPGEHIESTATHGTGCAFSSSLLCRLVAGESPRDAVIGAKQFVTEAIRRAPRLGHGKGPMHLLWPLSDSQKNL
jgi:hydroxymethylpyrimidine/phosphomethylpyrimidine kinase